MPCVAGFIRWLAGQLVTLGPRLVRSLRRGRRRQTCSMWKCSPSGEPEGGSGLSTREQSLGRGRQWGGSRRRSLSYTESWLRIGIVQSYAELHSKFPRGERGHHQEGLQISPFFDDPENTTHLLNLYVKFVTFKKKKFVTFKYIFKLRKRNFMGK